jgi:Uma2 family endonuclease
MAQRAQILNLPVEDLMRSYEREGPIPVTEEGYVRLALDDPGRPWELRDGLLVEKPGMSFVHGGTVVWLRNDLVRQLDPRRFLVYEDSGRLRRSSRNYLIPDVSVVPTEVFHRHRLESPAALGVFNEAMPFVAEVESPSTGQYDITTKIPIYRQRGDGEIWYLQPFERTLTTWVRQPDGQYAKTVYHGGIVELASFPGVKIDLDALFDFH